MTPRRLPQLFLAAALSVGLSGPAGAQVPVGAGLGLPGSGGPVAAVPVEGIAAGLPGTPVLGPRLLDRIPRLQALRVAGLLRSQRARVDVDPRGAPVLRGEFLALHLDATAREAVVAAGFELVVDTGVADDVQALGLDVILLRDQRARPAPRAMRALQRAAPSATFAFQHLYLPAAAATDDARPSTGSTPAAGVATAAGALRIGLIDGGVDAAAPALAAMRVEHFGCKGAVLPQAHGTAVAERLAGGSHGTLFAADLWCGDAVGRATLGLVEALAWMARERVTVINVSLVGPDNPVLSRAVQALVSRGHVLVGAVGNDGPAAPPLFPAAYPGVIGVTAVDARLKVLPESGSGPHVDFSAPGVVAAAGLRGTSFAAPLVARLAAGLVDGPTPDAPAYVEQALGRQARDLGKPGRDPRYGLGLVAP